MHGLDKVAHVSRVPGSASVRGIGLPAFKFPAVDGYLAPGPASAGWAPGSARRRTAAGGDASAGWLRLLSPTFAFRAWLCVLWDDHNDCSGPRSRLSESARARWQGLETLQTTFLMS